MPALLEQLREALAPQYEVDREVGRGGMGTVFIARDTLLDRKVAIKVLRCEGESSTAAERFLREARILARLSHPNIVTVHQAGQLGESFYYIMDYMDGETLAERLTRGRLKGEDVAKLGSDLLAALEVAHGHGIIHRDVKPSNVFLVGERALLADFGIAKHVAGSSSSLTEPGHRVGTPGYMPPEQAAGEEVTVRTDIYAAGIVLYEALTGQRWSMVAPTTKVDWKNTPPAIAR